MSKIQVNDIVNHFDNGAPHFPKGMSVGSGTTLGLEVGTGASVYSPSDNVLTLGTNNAEKVRIDSAGLLGVGNNNPTYKVSVKDTKADGTGVQMHLWNNSVDNTAGNVWSGIRFTGSTGDYETAEIKGWRSHPGTNLNSLSINTGGVERMVLSTSGVGIGTNAPNQKLHIHADGTSYIRFTDESSGTSATDGAIFGLDGNNLYAWNYEAGDFAVATSGNPKFTVKNSGNIEIPDGNLVVASGHGIDFSVTSNGSGTMTSELLDDYEEGTFTPSWSATGVTFTYGSDYRNGWYTKVGNVCHFSIYISSTVAPSGSTTNGLIITGLPFTSLNSNYINTPVTIGVTYHVNWPTSAKRMSGIIPMNGTQITPWWGYDNSSDVQWQADVLTNYVYMVIQGSYQCN